MGLSVLWALSLPGLVCLLVLLVALERFGLWFGGRSWLPWRHGSGRSAGSGRSDGSGPSGGSGSADRPELSAAGLDEFAAWLYAGKRVELQQRNTELMLRDDVADGAPRFDPETGIVTLPPPPSR